MDIEKEYIPVTVDKSHIITIGERLYTESIEFIREIVNNAYDADATLVEITASEDSIEIKDNGTGMDRDGLKQYFNIGSQQKLHTSRSPVYGRDRIGQFGIGKFASLSACERFEVLTKIGEFVGRVVFDKKDWEKSGNVWSLPLEILPSDFRQVDGTTVLLTGMIRRFELTDIEAKIIEGTPLKAPDFKVKLNRHTITPRSLTGQRIPFLEGTDFGPVHGEIIILPQVLASTDELGIEIKVKQVTVRRELFGMETWGKIMARVRGEVNADFLPITSDRTGFIKDSPEYKAFLVVMEKVFEDVKKVLHRLTAKKESRVVSRALNEALHRIYKALYRNPELSPFGAFPIADEISKGIGGAALLSEKSSGGKEQVAGDNAEKEKPAGKLENEQIGKKRKKKPKVKRLTPNAVIKKMKFGESGVSCVVDSFGEEGVEVFTEETTIYINRDHPLYKRESARVDTHILNLARLITQEIALMKDSKNSRQAFERQSRLLKDAFIENGPAS
ncbi:MAG: ATP-binding protein [Nitrospira bacterium HGW-Nitrospira-1]|nr:MAG: ATP-binding protein [Nitrospira bacterium HGW-Nitrospira-1]